MRELCLNVKDLYLQLRNRKTKKATGNEKTQLNGKFVREIKVRNEETWGWLRKGYLKKETEGLVFAAQD